MITKTSFRYGPNVLEVDISASDDIAGLAAPRRTVLDPILVDAARSAGDVVCHQTPLLRIDTDATGRVRDLQLRLTDGSTGAIRAELLIGADGLHSTVARQLDVPVTRHGGISDAFSDAELLTEAIMDGDFRRYERLGDELSMPLFNVLERIASYGWTSKRPPASTSSCRRPCATKRPPPRRGCPAEPSQPDMRTDEKMDR